MKIDYTHYIGKNINNWTILSFFVHTSKIGNSHIKCKAKCNVCKNIKNRSFYSIKSGKSKSCGCDKGEDVSGKKWGDLIAIKRTKDYIKKCGKPETVWTFLCKKCNQHKDIMLFSVKNGNTKSCGCEGSYNEISLKKRIKKVHGNKIIIDFSTFKSAKEKALFFDIEYGKFWKNVHCIIEGDRHPKYGKAQQTKKLRLAKKEILIRIKEKHGNTLTIDFSTYIASSKKCRFIDSKYGEFWTRLSPILKGHAHPKRGQAKYKKNCREKYGVDHPMQRPEIALKNAKSQKFCHKIIHWKTKEKIIATGSYEREVIRYLNKNKIDFLWQPETFILPKKVLTTPTGSKTSYRPDLYLIKEKKWVEIKGWMRGPAQPKWDWFKTQFPTAELWNKKILRKMGIMVN